MNCSTTSSCSPRADLHAQAVDNGVIQEIQAYIKGDREGGAKRYNLNVDGVGYATPTRR